MNSRHKYIFCTKMFLGFALAIALASSVSAKTLKMAYDADPVSLDPYEQLSGGTLQLSHMIMDPLIRWTQTFGFEPRLATRWTRIDESTMRFHLRKNVKFHSGNPFTAADVAFTFNRIKESPDFKGVFTSFTAANVIDSHTIDLVTDGSFPLLLNSATYIFPMDAQFYTGKDAKGNDKGAIVKHGDSFASSNTSGTGPFRVVERQQGVKVVFERFSDYWDTKSPGNVSKIVFTPIKESATRVAALLAGDVDFIAPVPPNDLKRIKSKANLVTMSGTRIISLQLNQKRVEQFKDARVRRAIVYAINNRAIEKKIMRGFATAAGQNSPEGYLGHDKDLLPRYDLKRAKELMKAAGFEDGFSVTMMAPNNRYVNDAKIAQAVVSMLAKINIKVDLTTMPKAQYWPKFDERAADIMMIGWHSDTEDTANFFEFLLVCPNADTGAGQYNSGNYCNPSLDAIIAKANEITDDKERTQLLRQAESIVYLDAAFVPLHWQNLAWAAKKNIDIQPVVNVLNFPYLGDLVIK